MNVLAASTVAEIEVPFVGKEAFAAGKGVPCFRSVRKAAVPVGIESSQNKTIFPATEDKVVGIDEVQGTAAVPRRAEAPLA